MQELVFFVYLFWYSLLFIKRMEKFDKWNEEKQKLNKLDYDNFYVNARDIYFTKMGINIGFEENWKSEFLRPVLVLKKVWNLFFTVALTSKWKDNNFYYHKINNLILSEKNNKYINSSYCILSQVKVMDKKRFTQNIWAISEGDFKNIQKKLKILLF